MRDVVSFSVEFNYLKESYRYELQLKPWKNEIIKEKIEFFEGDQYRTLVEDSTKRKFSLLSECRNQSDKGVDGTSQHLRNVFDWFRTCLLISRPEDNNIMDVDLEKTADILRHFDTGIERITREIVKETDDVDEFMGEFFKDYHELDDYRSGKESIYRLLDIEGRPVEVSVSGGMGRESQYRAVHTGIDEPFELYEESDGILKLIEYSSILTRDENDLTFVIDEFERKLHPNAALELYRLFISKKNRTQQLIFTTHETGFLNDDIMRVDETAVINKDRSGNSRMFLLKNDPDVDYLAYTEHIEHLLHGGDR